MKIQILLICLLFLNLIATVQALSPIESPPINCDLILAPFCNPEGDKQCQKEIDKYIRTRNKCLKDAERIYFLEEKILKILEIIERIKARWI